MDEHLKKRLVGAAVLTSLAVIFIPMLLDDRKSVPQALPEIPARPPIQDFASSMLTEEVPAVVPIRPRVMVEEEAKSPPVKQKPDKVVPPRTGLSAWVVQVGSFSSRDNATKLAQKLRKAKFQTPDPESVEIRGKRLWRVRVGPMVDKVLAERILPKVNKVAGLKGRVTRYP